MADFIQKATGPHIVLAGAGTGKTHTIVKKISYLIKNKLYEPEHIACLTFSNEAADSLKNRIKKELGQSKEPLVKTFHSFCADLLRTRGKEIEIPSEFKIITPDEAKILLHKHFKIHPQLCHRYIEALGVAKDLGIEPETLEAYLEKRLSKQHITNLQDTLEQLQFECNTSYLGGKRNRSEQSEKKEKLKEAGSLLKIKKFAQAWKAYEKIKAKKRMLDYADLHKKALELLKRNPSLSEEYHYIIVDEFQDTNKLQGELLEKIGIKRNVTVVGDLNQSIYRFRGAYKENISKFKEAFNVPPENIISLDKSYRSTNTVLRIAHKLIEKNYTDKKECFEVRNAFEKEGSPSEVIELLNEKEEIRALIDLIKKELKETVPEEIALLFRTHQQAARLKKTLYEEKIPFIALTKNALFATPAIRKVMAYLTIASKIQSKRKGGERQWWELLQLSGYSPEELAAAGKILKRRDEIAHISETMLNELPLAEWTNEKKEITIRIKNRLNEIALMLDKPVQDISKKMIELLSDELGQQNEVQINLDRFSEKVKEFSEQESNRIEDFLYHIEVMEKLGIDVEAPAIEQRGIRIMTHHATKGLEYECVICPQFVQGKFPAEKMRSNGLIPSEVLPDLAEKLAKTPEYLHEELIEDYEKENHLTEERRLCYVAFTRTKNKLYITYAKEYGGETYRPSQFLQEIEYAANPDIIYTQDNEEKAQKTTSSHAEIEKAILGPSRKASFSPSALLLFKECQKKYEYKYLYHMPEKEPASWEEIKLGSFIHEVIEKGIRANFADQKSFIEAAQNKSIEPEWNTINLDEAKALLKIFFQRNKHKYGPSSLIEINLKTKLDGISFEGFADRIDIHKDGLEIIDYKTGRTPVTPQHRNWQLGLYALAAKELGLGPVKKMTLDMLRFEKPLEFELSETGIAQEIHSKRMSFNLEEVKKELITTAQEILQGYEIGFKVCPPEKDCEFCNELFWKK